MGKIIVLDSERLRKHPIEEPEYYFRRLFRNKLLYRINSVAFSYRLRGMEEANGLQESIEQEDDLSSSPLIEEDISKLVNYLRGIGLENSRNLLKSSFGKKVDEKIEFVPNGKEIGLLLSDVLFNNWFVPKTPFNEEELERKVKNIQGLSGRILVRETPYLDEAMRVRYDSFWDDGDLRKKLNFVNTDWDRINTLFNECVDKANEKKRSKEKAKIPPKTLKYKLWDYLERKLFPLEHFANVWGGDVKITLEHSRRDLSIDFGCLVEKFTSYIINQIMTESRKYFEKTLSPKGRENPYDWDIYEEYFKKLVSRDIGEDLGRYAQYLVVRDMLPSEEQHFVNEHIFNFHKQGYWLAGFLKIDDNARKAVFWHL